MSQIDPRSNDQYTITLSSNRLLLAICGSLLLLVLSVMLGIRIERYQQREAVVLEARAGLADTPATPAAAPQAAPAPAPEPRRMITAEDLSDTVPPPAPVLLTKAAEPRPISTTPQPAPKPAPAPQKAAEPKPAPAPAKAEPTAKPGAGYVVQISSSRDNSAAAHTAKLLHSQGMSAFVETVDLGKQGVWYRVLAGSYASRTEADTVLAQLQRNPQFSSSFVRTY